MAKILQAARRAYDLVLIDAPPLLAVADPAIIAPLVDSVMLTVRINKNGRRPVEHAARILSDIEVEPAAVIVNGVDQDAKASYGYGTYSRDQYGYVGHYHDRYAAADVGVDVGVDRERNIAPPPHSPQIGRTGKNRTPAPGVAVTGANTFPTSQTPISR
jgi:Mrp family chromosome partitioning ATPase